MSLYMQCHGLSPNLWIPIYTLIDLKMSKLNKPKIFFFAEKISTNLWACCIGTFSEKKIKTVASMGNHVYLVLIHDALSFDNVQLLNIIQ